MASVCFGVDIGGTAIKMGCFDGAGKLISKWEIPTRKENNGEQILPDVVEAIYGKLDELSLDKNDVIGVGIGVPGPVFADGTVNRCVNLGWDVFNVSDRVKKLMNMPDLSVKVANDANVAALGEMYKGSGEGYKNIVMVTLGTGVGGGIILDGKILAGTSGAAGEIGHMPVEPTEEVSCSCGKKGCLEQYASATGIVNMAKIQMGDRAKNITAKDVMDLAKAGDEDALAVIERLGIYLGRALASVACVVNPQAFVIGGGVSKAGQFLIDYIEKNFVANVFRPCKDVKFVLANLGNDAGIYGAAALILI